MAVDGNNQPIADDDCEPGQLRTSISNIEQRLNEVTREFRKTMAMMGRAHPPPPVHRVGDIPPAPPM